MTYARDFGVLLMQHVEEPDLVGDGVMNEGEMASRLGLLGIPREAETVMLERDIRLVRLTGARYHAAMISCADSIEIVRRAKDDGLPVTCGASINNLVLNEGDIGHYRTFCRLSPPLRHESDRLAVVGRLNPNSPLNLYVLNLKTGGFDAVTTNEDMEIKTGPDDLAWSPAGTSVAIVARGASSGEPEVRAASADELLDAVDNLYEVPITTPGPPVPPEAPR